MSCGDGMMKASVAARKLPLLVVVVVVFVFVDVLALECPLLLEVEFVVEFEEA